MAVTRDGGCYGRPFNTYQGVTQGVPVSPTIFKIVVGTVVRATLLVLCVPQEDHNGLGCAVGEQYIVFYSDHVRISGRNPI